MSDKFFSAFSIALCVLSAGPFPGCSDRGSLYEISEVESVPAARRRVPMNMSSPERFGFAAPSQDAPGAKALALAWTVPAGWETLPTGGMRAAAFRIGQQSECSVTLLAGTAGGVEANVNRWRTQMGLDPLTPDEISALPKVTILDVPSPVVEMTGTFSGMAGEPSPNWALLGAICLLPDSSVFVKATGPADELLPQRQAFLTFCQSLRKATSAS